MPLDPEDAQQYYGSSGQFTNTRKLLQPGETMKVLVQDMSKNTTTKYPIKDKDYNYRVHFRTLEGKDLLLDTSGRDTIAQFVTALFPFGPSQPMQPCWVALTRRTERRTSQGELEITRCAPPEAAESHDLPI